MDNKKNNNNKRKTPKKPISQKKSNVIPMKKQDGNNKNLVNSKFLFWGMIAFFIVFFLLFIRLFILQIMDGSHLKESAVRQQTTARVISPTRGTIYDSTGKSLATSAPVDTVTINPKSIKDENKEKVAKAFSDIFALDYEETLAKVKSTNSIETIIKKVEQDKIDELKTWMKTNKLSSGINIDADTKRYYPYNNLASNLIGFCGTDNEGLEGLENYWNETLTGTPGRILSSADVLQDFIPDKNETYIDAQNGSDLTLSIDVNIQAIVEKYLKQAVLENNCKEGGNVIIMKPSTGDILAMASYPDYNLNTPFEPNENLKTTWDMLSSTDKNNALYKMWRNKSYSISDRYEPGSTFKIINASIGLEEGLVATDTPNDFLCNGYEMINGQRINCWTTGSHGHETLRQSLMQSCNPAMMQLGKRIGAETLYNYYKAYGLFDKTGIDVSGEASSYFWDLENVKNVELATMSFGQRFKITPLQLITAISAVANDGVLMKPRIVTQVSNTDNKNNTTVSNIDPVTVRQVISKETADKMMDMLESVVTDGTGRYGKVKGYSIAGKTGTSEPDVANPASGYTASYAGIAPSTSPEIVILVTLYNPKGDSHQGGQIAGPVVSQILTEVLPYLGIPSDNLETENSTNVNTISVPDVRNKTIAEAKKIIEAAGFICNSSTSDSSAIVTDQVPKPGTELLGNASINIYTATSDTRVAVEVPNLKGMTFTQAKSALKNKNLNIHISGTGTVISQDPMAGTSVEEGTVINVTLQQKITSAQ